MADMLMFSSPAMSAMVLASFRTLLYALADRLSRSISLQRNSFSSHPILQYLVIISAFILELVNTPASFLNLPDCSLRASATLSAIAALDSEASPAVRSPADTLSTKMCMSIRSIKGPEMRAM